MALRRLLIRYPHASHRRTLRTQASPDAEPQPPPKRIPRFKGRTVREIIRYPEADFDAAATTQQTLRSILQIQSVLQQRPHQLMDVAELTSLHPNLPVRDYPGVFKVIDYGSGSSLFCFTPEAEKIFKQGEFLREETEVWFVRALRKFLMMSVERRLPLRSVGLVAPEFGVVSGVGELVSRNPEVFEVSTTLDCTTWVRLKVWDPELAVSFGEVEDRQRQAGTMSQMEMWTPKGCLLSKRHRKVLARFREAPSVSPYTDFRDLAPLKIKLERHAVAAMQELLNLTLYKSLALRTLADFQTEFSFSTRPLDLALRHPEYFYVSPVGNQETVFLRSAYSRGELAKKSALVLLREQLGKLLENQQISPIERGQLSPHLGLPFFHPHSS